MNYKPDLPLINLAPEGQQLVNQTVQAHSHHSWRISIEPDHLLKIRIQGTLRDSLGHEASFDQIGNYAADEYTPREYTGCYELDLSVEGGYDTAQVVSYTAETRMTIIGSDPPVSNMPDKQSSSSKSIRIISDEQLLIKRFVFNEAGEERLFNPVNSTYEPVHDVTKEVQEISKLYLPLRDTEEFLKHRKDSGVEDDDRDSDVADPSEPYPPPGGNFGLGVQLIDGHLDFATSTTLYFYILAPTVLSGDPAKLLYLTSSNRAYRGCEALVLYKWAGEAVFAIWDWSVPSDNKGNRWVVALGYPHWDDYKLTHNLNGIDHQALYVVNATEQVSPGFWVNDVYLRKATDLAFYKVWHHEFSWNPASPSEKYRTWGPLIETFAGNYGETNIVGFADARIIQDGIDYVLNSANSYIRWECNGFQILYLDPNYNLLAR